MYNLERSFHDQAGYFLKIAKKCLQRSLQSLQEHFGLEQVSPKRNSHLCLDLLEKLTTVKFPPPVFIIPERSVFSQKYF